MTMKCRRAAAWLLLTCSMAGVARGFVPQACPRVFPASCRVSSRLMAAPEEDRPSGPEPAPVPPEPSEPNFFQVASRFYNELVPWGDPSKGMMLQSIAKRDAMVVKYMQKTGCSKEDAEREVTAYLEDKEGWIAKQTKIDEETAAKTARGG